MIDAVLIPPSGDEVEETEKPEPPVMEPEVEAALAPTDLRL